MYKSVVLNSEISKVLSDLGHGDFVVIGDCGLPIPDGVKRIDIALKAGTPSFRETYELLTESMYVERQVFAEEVDDAGLKRVFDSGIPSEQVPHEALKRMCKDAKAVIRTGETTPFANVLLYSNVFF
ncbi:D-ribose pyranase [Salinicoccus halodurans]|uniref:D-ribose pyranase n=1 Tax=Salinicoccus halodurans TaxID=407035 RepID=A0A0F7HKC3_9STAP|nr:D-ribose pyranase [Salinicoccus halodurans]AKG73529.1 ribose ABC transporter [Salinicoccus halodurans]SFK52112.1 ribose transport protein RbsD [Salinicoccus halodurans]